MGESRGEFSAPAPGTRLRDIALIGVTDPARHLGARR